MREASLSELQDWLDRDEARSRPARAEQLQRLLRVIYPTQPIMFMGSDISAQIFHELRLAYLHRLYAATVMLAITFIEFELGASLYAAGFDGAAGARLEDITKEAVNRRLIDADDAEQFNRLRKTRNAYVHVRKPLNASSLTVRALKRDFHTDDVLIEDADLAISAVARLLAPSQSNGARAFAEAT